MGFTPNQEVTRHVLYNNHDMLRLQARTSPVRIIQRITTCYYPLNDIVHNSIEIPNSSRQNIERTPH